MDFIIKSMQLSVEKYTRPQFKHHTLSRAAVLLDLKNIFNLVSQEKLLEVIHCKYLELYPLIYLLYGETSTVHFRWANGTRQLHSSRKRKSTRAVPFLPSSLHSSSTPPLTRASTNKKDIASSTVTPTTTELVYTLAPYTCKH